MKLGTSPAVEGDPSADADEEEERWVRCASCGGRLAREAAAISVNGAHEHEFMNPSAIRFRVACFREAPGCTAEGEPSTVWTWFPGFAWQVALCAACGAHVGWSFCAHASSFVALVRDRVA